MGKHLDFYFDFSSPYGFLASTQVKALAHKIGREIQWHPFMIGAVFKEYGGAPIDHPLKRSYNEKDFARRAKLQGIANARFPNKFPNHSIPAARVTYWISENAPDKLEDYILTAYQAFWINGFDTADTGSALNVAAELGLSRTDVATGIQSDSIKSKLREETENAIKRGVFGSPFILIDNEPFWGCDRFQDIETLYG